MAKTYKSMSRMIDISEVEIGNLVGEGGTSDIYHCRWEGIDYVIKIPRHGHIDDEISCIEEMKQIGIKGIVDIVGTTYYENKRCMIMERFPMDLATWLLTSPSIEDRRGVLRKIIQVYNTLLLNDMDHGDISMNNILIDDDLRIGYCDFEKSEGGNMRANRRDIRCIVTIIRNILPDIDCPCMPIKSIEDCHTYVGLLSSTI
jgi:RIO-like serine/threonine protein kinase